MAELRRNDIVSERRRQQVVRRGKKLAEREYREREQVLKMLLSGANRNLNIGFTIVDSCSLTRRIRLTSSQTRLAMSGIFLSIKMFLGESVRSDRTVKNEYLFVS